MDTEITISKIMSQNILKPEKLVLAGEFLLILEKSINIKYVY